MSSYAQLIEEKQKVIGERIEWAAINAEYAVRMDLQNRFKTGLEIAQYTADIMRKDMAAYDQDSSKYAVSRLLAWVRRSTSHDGRGVTNDR